LTEQKKRKKKEKEKEKKKRKKEKGSLFAFIHNINMVMSWKKGWIFLWSWRN